MLNAIGIEAMRHKLQEKGHRADSEFALDRRSQQVRSSRRESPDYCCGDLLGAAAQPESDELRIVLAICSYGRVPTNDSLPNKFGSGCTTASFMCPWRCEEN